MSWGFMGETGGHGRDQRNGPTKGERRGCRPSARLSGLPARLVVNGGSVAIASSNLLHVKLRRGQKSRKCSRGNLQTLSDSDIETCVDTYYFGQRFGCIRRAQTEENHTRMHLIGGSRASETARSKEWNPDLAKSFRVSIAAD